MKPSRNRSPWRAALGVLLPSPLLLAVLLVHPAEAALTEAEEGARARTLGRGYFLPDLDPPRAGVAADSIYLQGGGILEFGGGANMNRVDGFTPTAIEGVLNDSWVPSIQGYEAYGISSSDWSGAGAVFIHPGTPAVSIGGRWYDETAPWPLPVQAIRPEEDLLAALFVREDFYNYLRRRGSAAFAEWGPSPGRGLQVAWFNEKQKSQTRQVARFGPFGGHKEFRSNPPIDEGRWHFARARLLWAFEPIPKAWEDANAHAVLLDAQASGGSLGGSRRFLRLWGEARGRQKLTPSQFAGYRLAGGTTPQGTVDADGSRLPRQWRFRAGGVGSLRAHDFDQFVGDRLLLATLEYGVNPGVPVRPVLFLDWGKAWNQSTGDSGGPAGTGEIPYALDGGIGLQLGTGFTSARVDVARNLKAERAPIHVTFRFGVPY
jgi:hypothetical protein